MKTSEVSSFPRNEIHSSMKMSKIEELAVKKRSTANDSTYRVDAESNINAEEETPGILSNGWVLCHYYVSGLMSHFQLPDTTPPNDLANNCGSYFVEKTVRIIIN